MRSKLLFLMLVAGILFLPAAGWAGINLCSNPNFELDGEGIEDLTARTVGDCLDWQIWSGGTALEVQPATDHPTAQMQLEPGEDTWQETDSALTAEADTVYYLEADIKSLSGSAEVVTLEFEDSGWENDVELVVNVPASGWQRFMHILDTSESSKFINRR